jgi:glycosyltransferase involved in cell wall biosynthesis
MKLSVLLMTYNHAPFVEQAVRSVLDQRTSFPFEVVIAEDGSTDDTAAIVSRFESEQPDRVRVLSRGRNLGLTANFLDAYTQCRGAYVATLDGDDYWTAPDKLQRQVDFLDQNSQFSFCFHNVRVISDQSGEDGQEIGATADGQTIFELEDLVKGNFVPFGSVVARNRLIPEFADWVRDIPGIDWVFGMLTARRGPFARIDGCLGVYRKHAGGAWSSLPRARQINTVLRIYEGIRGDLPPRLGPLIDAMVLNIKLGSEWQLARERIDELSRPRPDDPCRDLTKRNAELEAYARDLQAKYAELDQYSRGLVDKYADVERANRDLDHYSRDLAEKYTRLEDYAGGLRDRYAALEQATRTTEVEAYAHDLQSKYTDLDRYSQGLVDQFTRLDEANRDLTDKYARLEDYTRGLQDRYAALEAYARSRDAAAEHGQRDRCANNPATSAGACPGTRHASEAAMCPVSH